MNFTKFWDNSQCIDQFEFGTTLLTNGINVTSPFNIDANYSRREYHRIKFEPFCQISGNLNVGLTLQMIPYFGVDFSVNYNKNKFLDDSIVTYFEIGRRNRTSFGGANYLAFCSSITNYIYIDSFTFTTKSINDDGFGIRENTSVSVPSSIECKDNYNIVYGLKGIIWSFALSYDISILSSNSTDIIFKLQGGYNTFDVTYIIFCDTSRILYHGKTRIVNSQFDHDSNGNRSISTVVTIDNSDDYSQYNQQIHDCSSVKVWLGSTSADTICDLSFWAQNPTQWSFDLVVVLFWANGDNTVCGFGFDSGITIQYLVFCVG